MNMKKILLAGIAVGALASTGAQAATITAAKVSNITLNVSTLTPTKLTVSNKINLSTPAAIAQNGVTTTTVGHNTVEASLSGAGVTQFGSGTGTLPGNGNTFNATFTLSGSANPVFARDITSASLATDVIVVPGGGACTASPVSLVSGGAVGGTAVTVAFSVTGSCDASIPANVGPSKVRIDVPLQISAAGNVDMTAKFTLPFIAGAPSYDGGPATVGLIQAVNIYDVAVSANPTAAATSSVFGGATQLPTLWAAAFAAPQTNPFTSYLPVSAVNDLTIGSAKAGYVSLPSVGASTAFYANVAATALPTLAPKFEIAALSSSAFNAMSPATAVAAGTVAPAGVVNAIGGALPAFTANAARTLVTGQPAASAVAAGAATTVIVNVSSLAGNNFSVSTNQAYSATVTAIPTNGTIPFYGNSDPVTGALETTTTQGFRIDAPWFGGSRASTPSLVRLSNNSTAATGGVTLTLANAVTNSGEALLSTTCTIGAGVPAGQELLINTAQATTCFGNFVRGDLSITVLGNVGSLTAKMRVLSSNGSVSEQTLGNVSASTAVLN